MGTQAAKTVGDTVHGQLNTAYMAICNMKAGISPSTEESEEFFGKVLERATWFFSYTHPEKGELRGVDAMHEAIGVWKAIATNSKTKVTRKDLEGLKAFVYCLSKAMVEKVAAIETKLTERSTAKGVAVSKVVKKTASKKGKAAQGEAASASSGAASSSSSSGAQFAKHKAGLAKFFQS